MIVRRDDVDDLPRMVDGPVDPVGVTADGRWTITFPVTLAPPSRELRPRRKA